MIIVKIMGVVMERDRECRLLLNDLNDILSEQCLGERVRCRYLNVIR